MPRVEHTITKLMNGGQLELVDLVDNQLEMTLFDAGGRHSEELTRRDALRMIALLSEWLERTGVE